MAFGPRRWWVVSALALATGIAVPASLAPRAAPAQDTFRSATDAVWVIATAIDKDGKLVTDLARDDFEVRDKGDVVSITTFRNDPVPFALVIMLDVSLSMVPNLPQMRRGIQQLANQFGPGDRAAIGTFTGLASLSPRFTANPELLSSWVTSTMGGAGVPCEPGTRPPPATATLMTTERPGRPVPDPRTDSFNQVRGVFGSALWDAIQCGVRAVSADVETPRRVVLVVSDGKENSSVTNEGVVRQLADQYGVMVYGIGMFGSEAVDEGALRGLANTTGGGYLFVRPGADLVSAFARVAEELRHQYVFGVSPPSTDPAGRDLEVTVRRPGLTTHARRVFLSAPAPLGRSTPIAAATRAGDSSAASKTPSKLATIDRTNVTPSPSGAAAVAFLDYYERGGAAVRAGTRPSPAGLRNLQASLSNGASSWVAAGAAEAPRRRLAVATFVLDVLQTQFSDTRLWKIGQPAGDLLEWACDFLREEPVVVVDGGTPRPPFMAEQSWYIASLAMLERVWGSSDTAADAGSQAKSGGNIASSTFTVGRELFQRHVEHAAARFPDEPRWALARAIALELQTRPASRDEHTFSVVPMLSDLVLSEYANAATVAGVRQEALVRWGAFELRRGSPARALEHMNEAGTPDDIYVRFWLHFWRGRALERADRLPEAIESYQLALDDAPFAQSARTALAAALKSDHRTSEASTRASGARNGEPYEDPWDWYAFPDWRFLSIAMAELRKTIGR